MSFRKQMTYSQKLGLLHEIYEGFPAAFKVPNFLIKVLCPLHDSTFSSCVIIFKAHVNDNLNVCLFVQAKEAECNGYCWSDR